MFVSVIRYCTRSRLSLTVTRKSNLNVSERIWNRHNCFSATRLKYDIDRTGFSNLGALSKIHCAPFSSEKSYDVTHKELLELQGNKEVVIIDVREPSEIAETGKLPGSIHIPLGELKCVLEELSNKDFELKYEVPKPGFSTPLVFSCKSGKRSMTAMENATKLGFKNVRHYGGGFQDWEEKSKKYVQQN